MIGANFGDEGKGLVTDWLCSQGADWVVRFNGGANCGHTVVRPSGERHVFKHFGSGALAGVPTYLSQFVVCNPILFFEELDQLHRLGVANLVVAAHPDCLITTYVDMLVNQFREDRRGEKRHGSCGVGIHETMARSQVSGLRLTLGDVWNGADIESRIKEIGTKWAAFRVGKEFATDEAIETFIECLRKFAQYVHPMGIAAIKDPVFEGAQGLLLSQDNKEYAPHLTHSYTGARNARWLCEKAGMTPELFYVSRSYLTRHGAGKLPGEDPAMLYADNTNVENRWQGPLRFAPLDSGFMQRIAKDAGADQYRTVVTHCDQRAAPFEADFYANGPTMNDISAARLAAPVARE